jgi:trans-2,3-dihydro-3-hydroxyanthranilate isomerase
VQLSYDVVDVFTERAYAGNPLAVVYGAEGLQTSSLQSIAREFNLSETTFPLPLSAADREAGADYRLRIFTPGGEIPFAGHPTLGTAWALRAKGVMEPGKRIQSCPAGLIEVDVPEEPTDAVELQAAPRDLSAPLSQPSIAALLSSVGLEASDVVAPVYAAGCGLSFLHVPVQPDAVGRARASGVPLAELPVEVTGVSDPLDGVNVFALDGDGDAPSSGAPAQGADGLLHVHARVFVPGLSVPEDPATGSAAVGLGVALAALGLADADGQTAYRIRQGAEMGRPSVLHGRVETRGGEAVKCSVAGNVVPVATGSLTPPNV